MALGYIASDPTTWTDFRDPSAHGFVKVKRRTPLETLLRDGGIVLGVAAALCSWLVFVERSGLLMEFERPWLWPAGLVAAGGLMLLVNWLTESFYLIDPSRHLVYFHFKIGFVRRVGLCLSRANVLAACAETRRRREEGSSWWEHRAAIVRTDGRIVPMANWQKDALWQANNAARELSHQLGCEWREVSDQQRLVVRRKDGRATVTFERFTWLTSLDPDRATTVAVVALAALAMLARWLRLS